MKNTTFTLLFLCLYSYAQSCSFDVVPFCKTINERNPENVVLRGYFSEDISNGLVFTRLETLRGDEDRDQINVWNNIPFDCNGILERNASNMGVINQEIIISLTIIDSLYSEYETLGDYRVPDGLWWETHNLNVEGDSVTGYYIFSIYNPTIETIHYDEFIDKVIDKKECISTSTNNTNIDDFKVYPTLVNDYINIKFNPEIRQSKLYVLDATGKLVISGQLSSSIYLGTLAKGMYIVIIETKDNLCYHQKIIKL